MSSVTVFPMTAVNGSSQETDCGWVSGLVIIFTKNDGFSVDLLYNPRISLPFRAGILPSFGENWHQVTEFIVILNQGETRSLVRRAKMLSLKTVITSYSSLEK